MTTQITNVYVKKEGENNFLECEQVYNGATLVFQKSPIRDAYYDYTRVTLTITAFASPYYSVRNDTNYGLDVIFNNGQPYHFNARQTVTFALAIMPVSVSINGCPSRYFSTTPSTNWYHNSVPYQYHPAEYKRELIIE